MSFDICCSENVSLPLTIEELEGYLQSFLETLGFADRGVILYFCDDEEIQSRNAEFRGKDAPTDVLSWSYWEEAPGTPILGEIMISIDAVGRQAGANGWNESVETLRLLAHACAHLVGYDHEISEAEEQRMLAMEHQMLTKVQLSYVYGS